MGRPRKTKSQRIDAKKANAANMQDLEKMVKEHQSQKPEKKRPCYNTNRTPAVKRIVHISDSPLKYAAPAATTSENSVHDPQIIASGSKSIVVGSVGSVSSHPLESNNDETSSGMEVVFQGFCEDQSNENSDLLVIKKLQEEIDKKTREIRLLQEENTKRQFGNSNGSSITKQAGKPLPKKVVLSDPISSTAAFHVSKPQDYISDSPLTLPTATASEISIYVPETIASGSRPIAVGPKASHPVRPPSTTVHSNDSSISSEEAIGLCDEQFNENSDEVIRKLQEEVKEKSSLIRLLQEEIAKLRSLNMLLQESLMQKGPEGTFTEYPGYPTSEWLLSVSQNSDDSDYLFTKELLFHLFPEGIGNATATGRASNNPKGRSKEASDPECKNQPTAQLDPDKLKYIRDRLYERRRLLQDPVGVAFAKAKMINRLVATVIANNPSLRNKQK
ncbi:uncharacterized protein LOC134214888 isoform X2 [Armigeres subalbatus]|uniref:uncharacterized protein LOC134214888 isoform X2 n=1 Tax=Armigeres subalbatus TaxID=124917 RepID=UPI002ED3CCB1